MLNKLTIELVDTGLKYQIDDKQVIQSATLEQLLLFAILEKLEEIRCGLIDVETKIEESNDSRKHSPPRI